VAVKGGEHSSRTSSRGGVKHNIPKPAGFKRWLGGIQNRYLMDVKMQRQPYLYVSRSHLGGIGFLKLQCTDDGSAGLSSR
jgi:hypothetical protein